MKPFFPLRQDGEADLWTKRNYKTWQKLQQAKVAVFVRDSEQNELPAEIGIFHEENFRPIHRLSR